MGLRHWCDKRRPYGPGARRYRTPTDAEWEDFLGHFERRKLSVGTCARAYGTACIHEHAPARAAHCFDQTQHSAAAWWKSATTSSTGSPRQSGKAGPAKSKDSR